MDILISTLNARFSHASLATRYLLANLDDDLRARAEICEFTIQQDTEEILATVYDKAPKIILLGVYIWNINETTKLVRELKALMPELIIVIGGPEVSHEYEETAIFTTADYLITGWGDISAYELCRDILNDQAPNDKVIKGKQPKLEEIKLPYDYYTDFDIAHRTIYVEASRGCPFKCEFCLSSLDKTAWTFPLEDFLAAMDRLYQRGLRQFKFIDRTFNLKREFTVRILNFFLDKLAKNPEDALFLHFELVPDFLPEEIKALILKFPEGSLQFEIGIQTLNTETQQLISRRTNLAKAKENISWLSKHTSVHLHVDLIAGLPAEDLEQFAKGFNELWSWEPQEIQLGILKRLKGTPITRHTDSFDYRYSPEAPYSVFANKDMDFTTMNQMKNAAKFWDLIANSGRFNHTLPLLFDKSAFETLWQLSDYLVKCFKRTHSIPLDKLLSEVFNYLVEIKKVPIATVQTAMGEDFMRIGLQGWPKYLGDKPADFAERLSKHQQKTAAPKRQQQHL
ncbi:DUF4080 domain-containing protein [Wohlfahrtiimonas chitiniclastica]|uniref:B12-binding domain-containing radical SAM protein n=1 Tax=Wohlfahrtiimonas chitiniclastica TaxID=400946 RepID=UPI001BCFB237|nr:DUF4080 domain-containing protein [Wohlfahrtiimonas chitiniclastica]MBS7817995.1 DUF4080 domain-containing protein [Wohlfahrtiimonas chitiniclastica]MBS7825962.1 DUF4080 domain-containing protein [Wohlfahrtiimonas chitiniclastica]